VLLLALFWKISFFPLLHKIDEKVVFDLKIDDFLKGYRSAWVVKGSSGANGLRLKHCLKYPLCKGYQIEKLLLL